MKPVSRQSIRADEAIVCPTPSLCWLDIAGACVAPRDRFVSQFAMIS
jgi:hypothetical protein